MATTSRFCSLYVAESLHWLRPSTRPPPLSKFHAKSLVHRDTVKEFILKQARDAGLEGCRIIVKGLVSANTCIVKFDEDLQRSLRKDKTRPDKETHFYNKKVAKGYQQVVREACKDKTRLQQADSLKNKVAEDHLLR